MNDKKEIIIYSFIIFSIGIFGGFWIGYHSKAADNLTSEYHEQIYKRIIKN